MNPNDANVRVDFVDEVGDSFEEFVVYHPRFIDWMRATCREVKSLHDAGRD